MLSIFTLPKPFENHTGTIQRNAAASWLQLDPKPEIFVMGDESGTADLCSEMNLKHIPEIARNASGTPLISDMFAKIQNEASNDIVCYVNADMILLQDVMDCVQQVQKNIDTSKKDFLIVGNRWELNIEAEIDFSSEKSREELKLKTLEDGKLVKPAYDYFIFPKKLFKKIPPFALGRMCWDIWLAYEAVNLGAYLIDATDNIQAIHQNHDYLHLGEKFTTRNTIKSHELPEIRENRKLCGNRILRLIVPSYKLSDEKLKISLLNLLTFFYYGLRRNISCFISG